MTKTDTTVDLRNKFLIVEDALNDEIFERHTEIRGLLLAVLSRKHIFLLGEPGLAKSFLLERFVRRLNGIDETNGLFIRQIFKTTNDSELFGPYAISKLEQDRYERITEGRLPGATFAFLDEIGNGSSSILAGLLRIMQERKFENGPDVNPDVPLITLMSASNSLFPAELSALSDRFHLRFNVQPLRDESALAQMLLAQVEPNPEKVLSITDIEAAQIEVGNVKIGDEIISTLLKIKEQLAVENVTISDRRLKQSIDVLRASAWLNGNSEAQIEDITPLQNMFWKEIPEISKVRNIVCGLSDPLEAQIVETLENFNMAFAEFERNYAETDDPTCKSDIGFEVLQKWNAAKRETVEYSQVQADTGRLYRSLSVLKKRLRDTIVVIVEEGLKGNVKEEDVADLVD